MYNRVSISLTKAQAAQLIKFCQQEKDRKNRQVARLNAKMSELYNEIYDLSDLASDVADTLDREESGALSY